MHRKKPKTDFQFIREQIHGIFILRLSFTKYTQRERYK